MKLRLLLASLVVLVARLSFGEDKPKPAYIPIPCIGRMQILDWGKCTRDGQDLLCPNTKVRLVVGCYTTKPEAEKLEGKVHVDHPAVVELDGKK